MSCIACCNCHETRPWRFAYDRKFDKMVCLQCGSKNLDYDENFLEDTNKDTSILEEINTVIKTNLE